MTQVVVVINSVAELVMPVVRAWKSKCPNSLNPPPSVHLRFCSPQLSFASSGPQQGQEELRPDCHFQRGKVRGCVRRNTLHVLPLILQTEGEPCVCSLWVVAGHGNPHGHHAAKPVYFACIALDEATQVSLPARVMDV